MHQMSNVRSTQMLIFQLWATPRQCCQIMNFSNDSAGIMFKSRIYVNEELISPYGSDNRLIRITKLTVIFYKLGEKSEDILKSFNSDYTIFTNSFCHKAGSIEIFSSVKRYARTKWTIKKPTKIRVKLTNPRSMRKCGAHVSHFKAKN